MSPVSSARPTRLRSKFKSVHSQLLSNHLKLTSKHPCFCRHAAGVTAYRRFPPQEVWERYRADLRATAWSSTPALTAPKPRAIIQTKALWAHSERQRAETVAIVVTISLKWVSVHAHSEDTWHRYGPAVSALHSFSCISVITLHEEPLQLPRVRLHRVGMWSDGP